MKQAIALILAMTLGIAANATPLIRNYYSIVIDESGHGFIVESIGNQVINSQALSFSTSIADPYAVAHPDNSSVPNPLTLSYALPASFGGLDLSRLTIGDIILNDSTSPGTRGQTQKSDLIRIGANGRLYSYSDIETSDADPGNQALADVGIPSNTQLINSFLTEHPLNGPSAYGVAVPNYSSGYDYVPTRGQAGYVTNAIVNFYIISRGPVPAIPEPGTVVAGALMLVPLGAAFLRRMLKS